MFERSLESLIKGFRSHRGKDEAAYLSTVLAEIRAETQTADMEVKANGVLKLVYLQMLGHVSANAAFAIVEVMAARPFHLKFVGYLAAAQCLPAESDVLILATNLLRKDLASPLELDVMAALSVLPHLMTPALAQHLEDDVIALANHSKPVVRKKAVVALYYVILAHPSTLDKAWIRLQDRLEDESVPVKSATVSILTELALRPEPIGPKALLPLAPQLFSLLTNCTNNWVSIKIIKLFAALSSVEPRMARRLLPALTTMLETTSAMSLVYECVHAIIVGGMLRPQAGQERESDRFASLCIDKLGTFLGHTDQNLRYIALVGLIKLLPTHAHLVRPLHDEVVRLAHDASDSSVRLQAFTLLTGLVTPDTFSEYTKIVMGILGLPTGEDSIDSDTTIRAQGLSAGAPQGSAAARLKGLLHAATPGESLEGAAPEETDERGYVLAGTNRLRREVRLAYALVGAKDDYALLRPTLGNALEVETARGAYLLALFNMYPQSDLVLQRLIDRQFTDMLLRFPDTPLPSLSTFALEPARFPLTVCILRVKASQHRLRFSLDQLGSIINLLDHSEAACSATEEHALIQILLDLWLAALPDADAARSQKVDALVSYLTRVGQQTKSLETRQRSTEALHVLTTAVDPSSLVSVLKNTRSISFDRAIPQAPEGRATFTPLRRSGLTKRKGVFVAGLPYPRVAAGGKSSQHATANATVKMSTNKVSRSSAHPGNPYYLSTGGKRKSKKPAAQDASIPVVMLDDLFVANEASASSGKELGKPDAAVSQADASVPEEAAAEGAAVTVTSKRKKAHKAKKKPVP